MRYQDKDGTIYAEQQMGANIVLCIEATENPNVKRLYAKIAESMRSWFQPVNFRLQGDGMVVVCNNDVAACGYYLKQIQGLEDKIVVTLFGNDLIVNFPIDESSKLYHNEALIAPKPSCDENHTTIFDCDDVKPHSITKGSVKYSAFEDEQGEYIQVEGACSFGLNGELVYVSPNNMFEVKHPECHRVWSTQANWNTFVSKLPTGIDLFFNLQGELCIRGIPLAEHDKQTLIVDSWGISQNGMWLEVRTLANAIEFILQLKLGSNQIDVVVWDKTICSLDYTNNNFWR